MTLNVTEPDIHDFGKLSKEQEILQLSVLAFYSTFYVLLGDIRKGIFESYMMLWALIASGSGAKEVVTLAPPYFQVTEYPRKRIDA